MTSIRPLHYAPWPELTITPHIMVDGGAKVGTTLTLSHWPKNPTPDALKEDTSTGIVFHYLNDPSFHVGEDVVWATGDHFDEDATMGIFALIDPDFALAHEEIITQAAHAGDFVVSSNSQASRISFAIKTMVDPKRSPLDKAIFELPYDDFCAAMFREVLPRVRPLIEHTDAFNELWAMEDGFFDRSQKALIAGEITIEENDDLSFVVVSCPDDIDLRDDDIRADDRLAALPYHPMAINNATQCNRVLNLTCENPIFSYRYESWVQYKSRTITPRVDLSPVRDTLNAMESNNAQWQCEGVAEIRPCMNVASGTSTIEAIDLINVITEHLKTAEPAWDPFAKPISTFSGLALSH